MIAGVDYTGVVVTFLCHDGNKNFILGKRSKDVRDFSGHWDFGGGKLEFKESVEEAINRELQEEFGCTGVVEDFLPPIARFYPEMKMHWLVLRYIIRVDRDQVKNNNPRTIEEIGWFRFDSLPKPLHHGIVKDLEIYRPYLEKYL